jgi:hypothetical protein
LVSAQHSFSMAALPPCGACAAPDADQRCTGCRAVYYCNAACQRAHWKKHKVACREAARAAAPAPPANAATDANDADPMEALRQLIANGEADLVARHERFKAQEATRRAACALAASACANWPCMDCGPRPKAAFYDWMGGKPDDERLCTDCVCKRLWEDSRLMESCKTSPLLHAQVEMLAESLPDPMIATGPLWHDILAVALWAAIGARAPQADTTRAALCQWRFDAMVADGAKRAQAAARLAELEAGVGGRGMSSIAMSLLHVYTTVNRVLPALLASDFHRQHPHVLVPFATVACRALMPIVPNSSDMPGGRNPYGPRPNVNEGINFSNIFIDAEDCFKAAERGFTVLALVPPAALPVFRAARDMHSVLFDMSNASVRAQVQRDAPYCLPL